jgi:superfamily I DNA/RNA helicase
VLETDEAGELRAAVARVLESKSRKKLIVAGPGAGKTTLFRQLLAQASGAGDDRLVLTFIKNLKEDLDRSLGETASVYTLHAYCQLLLRRHAELRDGMTADFICHPGLTGMVKQDWQWLNEEAPPKFVERMRSLECTEAQEQFYLERSAYYDAVDFDDSVYRITRRLNDQPHLIPAYELVLIDEFQDFNGMESEIINLLSRVSPIVIAGDDDQALYSQLRGASWEHIRAHHAGGEYEVFELPFCMRCPKVIVGAINDVIAHAVAAAKLTGRIPKPFRYFPPVKGKDSEKFPQIDLVRTSVQSAPANYFGKYVEQLIRSIPDEDFAAAAENFEPCVLIIGSKPYLPQVAAHLIAAGLIEARADETQDERSEALMMLHTNPDSNLGWRILLSGIGEAEAKGYVITAAQLDLPLSEVLPDNRKAGWLVEAAALAANRAEEPAKEAADAASPRIVLTTYEGSKGRSAQYVVLVGLHDGDLPRQSAAASDIEICKFLVGLTRTKKQCTLLATRRFGAGPRTLSSFVGWIREKRFRRIEVNAQYWKDR